MSKLVVKPNPEHPERPYLHDVVMLWVRNRMESIGTGRLSKITKARKRRQFILEGRRARQRLALVRPFAEGEQA